MFTPCLGHQRRSWTCASVQHRAVAAHTPGGQTPKVSGSPAGTTLDRHGVPLNCRNHHHHPSLPPSLFPSLPSPSLLQRRGECDGGAGHARAHPRVRPARSPPAAAAGRAPAVWCSPGLDGRRRGDEEEEEEEEEKKAPEVWETTSSSLTAMLGSTVDTCT